MTKSEIIEAVHEALGNHPCRYTMITLVKVFQASNYFKSKA